MKVAVLLVAFLLSACHGYKTGTYDPAKYQQVNRDDYAYKRVNDAEVVIVAKDEDALKRAMQEVGCGKEFVCIVDTDGEAYTVEQRKKQ